MGILILGEAGDLGISLLQVRVDSELYADQPPLQRSITRNFPAMLNAQMHDVIQANEGASIDIIVDAFEESLRNSVYVSDQRRDEQGEILGIPGLADEERWQAIYPTLQAMLGAAMVARHVNP